MIYLGKFVKYTSHSFIHFTFQFDLNFVYTQLPFFNFFFFEIVIKRVINIPIYKFTYEIADSLLISNIEFCDISVSSSSSSISISKMSNFFRLSERTEATCIINMLICFLLKIINYVSLPSYNQIQLNLCKHFLLVSNYRNQLNQKYCEQLKNRLNSSFVAEHEKNIFH